ncbi:MAG: ATP-binding protein, partial [Bacteroidia bacterium]
KNMNSVVDFNKRQIQSQQIISSVNKSRSAILEIEASSRGFALTGNNEYLKEYNNNVKKAINCCDSFAAPLKSDSVFIKRKDIINNLITSRIAFSDSVINLRQTSGITVSSGLVATRRGDELTEKIIREIDQLENYQYEISNLYNAAESAAANRTIFLFSILVLLIVLVLTIVFILFKDDLKWRRKSEERFKNLNESLEIKVHERVKELEESRSNMNAILENSIDAIWSIDTEFKLIGYNKLYRNISKEMLGIDIEVGMDILENIEEKSRYVWKGFYQRAISGERFTEELTKFYSGANHIYDVSFNPIMVNNKVKGVAIFAHEITLKKINELKLIESSARMNAVLENSSDSIWSVDKNLRLISFNNSYFESTKLFFDIEAYIGMPMLDHLNEVTRITWAKLYERALKGEHFSEETEDTTIGLELFFDISFNPIIVNNEITGVAIFARDISSRKNIERQLEYKVKELNTFMYKATHDLRSPLVSVMGLVQLAKDQTADNELLKYFDMIDLSVHKMDNLLIDLVKIVNVSQGKLIAESIDFDSIIDDILISLSHYPEFSEIVFKRQIHSDVVFKSDKRLLYSIFQNLIDNAIKYKRPSYVVEPLIIITANVSAEQVQIGITDNGIGIPEGVKDRVFEMFYRGNSSPNGTGLGLYIVKTSVEKLGGKIMLNSIEGKGTSINVIIPNAQAPD